MRWMDVKLAFSNGPKSANDLWLHAMVSGVWVGLGRNTIDFNNPQVLNASVLIVLTLPGIVMAGICVYPNAPSSIVSRPSGS